ncbi:MAG: glycosyltransferase family 39 protein [Pirellulales bacterium]
MASEHPRFRAKYATIDRCWRRLASSDRAGLYAALIVALALQAAATAVSPVIAPDGIKFIEYAKALAADPLAAIRSHDQHPGFPALMLAVRPLTGWLFTGESAWIAAARLVSGLAGIAAVVLVWAICRQLLDRRSAGVAALLFALLPVPRQNAADALSDSTHLLLFLVSVWLACRALHHGSTLRLLAAGAMAGVAFWVRPEGVIVATAVVACALLDPRWRSIFGWKRTLTGCAAVAIGAAAVVGPYVALSGKLTSKVTSKPGWQYLRAAARPDPQPADALRRIGMGEDQHDRPWQGPLVKGMLAALEKFINRLAESYVGVLLIPLVIGIVRTTRQVERPVATMMWLLSSGYLALLILLYQLGGYIDRRHLIPLMALLAPSLASGSMYLAELARQWSRRYRTVGVVSGALAVSLLVVLIVRSARPLHESYLHRLEVAGWLRDTAQPGDSVASNAIHVVYYSGIPGQYLTAESLVGQPPLDSPQFASQNRFLVVELDEDRHMPAWLADVGSDYQLVARVAGKSGTYQRDLVLYRARRSNRTASTAGRAPSLQPSR